MLKKGDLDPVTGKIRQKRKRCDALPVEEALRRRQQASLRAYYADHEGQKDAQRLRARQARSAGRVVDKRRLLSEPVGIAEWRAQLRWDRLHQDLYDARQQEAICDARDELLSLLAEYWFEGGDR